MDSYPLLATTIVVIIIDEKAALLEKVLSKGGILVL